MRGRKWPLNAALSGFALQFIRAVCVSRVLPRLRPTLELNVEQQSVGAVLKEAAEDAYIKQVHTKKNKKTTAHLRTRIPHKPVCSSDLLQDFDE